MNTIDKPSILPAGWYNTAKYGEVFISHDATAWTVQIIDNQLKSMPIKIIPSDIIKTTSIERLKHAQVMRTYRKSKSSITQPPIFAPQAVTDA